MIARERTDRSCAAATCPLPNAFAPAPFGRSVVLSPSPPGALDDPSPRSPVRPRRAHEPQPLDRGRHVGRRARRRHRRCRRGEPRTVVRQRLHGRRQPLATAPPPRIRPCAAPSAQARLGLPRARLRVRANPNPGTATSTRTAGRTPTRTASSAPRHTTPASTVVGTPAVAEAEHVVDVMGTRAHVIVSANDLEIAEVLARSAVARLRATRTTVVTLPPRQRAEPFNANAGRPVSSRPTRSCSSSAPSRPGTAPTAASTRRCCPRSSPPATTATSARPRRRLPPPTEPAPAPGCDGIAVRGHEVTLPLGVMIDPGGIGKGLAADLVVDLVMTSGSAGRVRQRRRRPPRRGSGPDGPPWSVAIEHPLEPRRALGPVTLHDEALVSSWRTRRTWGWHDGRTHHLIDPGTGSPAWTGLAGVTVLAPEAWWAEALATGLFLAGPDEAPDLVRHHGVTALLVRDDGAVRGSDGSGPASPRPRRHRRERTPSLVRGARRGGRHVGTARRLDDLGAALRDPGARPPRLVMVAARRPPVPRRLGRRVHRRPRHRAPRRQLTHFGCWTSWSPSWPVAPGRSGVGGPRDVRARRHRGDVPAQNRVPHRVWRSVHLGCLPAVRARDHPCAVVRDRRRRPSSGAASRSRSVRSPPRSRSWAWTSGHPSTRAVRRRPPRVREPLAGVDDRAIAAATPSQLRVSTDFPGSTSLYTAKKCSISASRNSGRSSRSARAPNAGRRPGRTAPSRRDPPRRTSRTRRPGAPGCDNPGRSAPRAGRARRAGHRPRRACRGRTRSPPGTGSR